MANIDEATVAGFDEIWSDRGRGRIDPLHYWRTFDAVFSLLPLGELGEAEGFDLGCGSGRWAWGVAGKVGRLHCIDPAPHALEASRRRMAAQANVEFHLADAGRIPLADSSQDFGYSMGVLHHIPDTEAAMRACVRKLKPGAPFLCYLYYSFDNRPLWFRLLWKTTEPGRHVISRLPFRARKALATLIAAGLYLPLSRAAGLFERLGLDVDAFPLSYYRRSGFRTLRSNALDRFGTRLEQRFSRRQIEAMMNRAGLEKVRFGEGPPYWIAVGRKA